MPPGHQNLVAWQRAMDFAAAVYTLASQLRRRGHSSLASQLERAVVSIPANIAEGKGRGSPREFSRFLSIALGSLREAETLVVLAQRLGVAKAETALELLKRSDELGKVLFGLRRIVIQSADVRRPKPTAVS